MITETHGVVTAAGVAEKKESDMGKYRNPKFEI